jgi:hypothetical protein
MTTPTTLDLKEYRGPVVSSLGVLVGFLLGFLGQWVTEETFALNGMGDLLTFWGSIAGAILLLFALFRMLTPMAPSEEAAATYRRILRLYAAGVAIPLTCILLSAFL